MKHENSNPDELVSALVDGELNGQAFLRAVEWLEERDDARTSWHTYHLVGDVLRSGELAAVGANDAAFLARLRQRLQGEAQFRPTGIAVDLTSADEGQHSAGTLKHREDPGANDAGMRWKLVAGFASLTAVALVGWQLLASLREPAGAPQLARIEVSPALEQAPVMIRDPRLDQLLAAHQQSGGISGLQVPAGFLRDATFAVPAR
jgi:sigma-E factor negative regulatory protein RseA